MSLSSATRTGYFSIRSPPLAKPRTGLNALVRYADWLPSIRCPALAKPRTGLNALVRYADWLLFYPFPSTRKASYWAKCRRPLRGLASFLSVAQHSQSLVLG